MTALPVGRSAAGLVMASPMGEDLLLAAPYSARTVCRRPSE
jgi:hypothetical protein